MKERFRLSICLTLLLVHLLSVQSSGAQVPELTGQNVVPVFEGYEQNADGSYEMFFGYFNRNFQEELNIPIGPENNFSPGDADRGQPSFFYPRRQMFLFHVRVPKDWGDKDLVWTLTTQGRTEKAYGHIQPLWLINDRLIAANVHGSSNLDVVDNDKPPSVRMAPVPIITYPEPASLTVSITDDGVPKPGQRRPRALPREGEQTFLNAPLPVQPRWPPGVNMTWIQYRGPGKVTFSPGGFQPVANGKDNSTIATFSEPGTYVLQVAASDSVLETRQNVTVTVVGTKSK